MVWIKFILILIIFNAFNTHKTRSLDANNEFIVQFNDTKFMVLLYLKEKIQITLMEIEVISSTYYYIELTLETLCKYNKIFKQYDTLKDAYDCIKKLFEKEKIKIYNTDNNFSLGFIMNSASCDNEEVIFKLSEKKMNKDEINEKVRIETNILTNKVKTLEEENKELKNKINEYDIRLGYLELKDEYIDTKILTKKSQLIPIINELEEKYKKKNIKFYNKYRASKDGNKYDNLHTILQSKNFQNLLLLFHTTKDLKFGIFLYEKIKTNSQNSYQYNYNYNYNYNHNYENNKSIEPKTFIFSINNNKIYDIEKSDKIICFNNKCSNDDSRKECLINFCNNNLLNSEKNMDYINKLENITNDEMNGGEKYFNLQEIEVFDVSYTDSS